jgi:hypothetical protein
MIEFLYTKKYDDDVEERISTDLAGVEPEGQIASVSLLVKPDGGDTANANANDEDASNPPLSKNIGPSRAATQAMTTAILLRHVQVNAIADYYNIPELKQLSNTKIKHCLETTWSADGFSDIVREVFDSTGDTVLREMMASTAAAHIKELVGLEDFAALDVMSDFTTSVIRKMTQRLRTVEFQLQETEIRLQSAEERYTHETDRADGIIENMQVPRSPVYQARYYPAMR